MLTLFGVVGRYAMALAGASRRRRWVLIAIVLIAVMPSGAATAQIACSSLPQAVRDYGPGYGDPDEAAEAYCLAHPYPTADPHGQIGLMHQNTTPYVVGTYWPGLAYSMRASCHHPGGPVCPGEFNFEVQRG